MSRITRRLSSSWARGFSGPECFSRRRRVRGFTARISMSFKKAASWVRRAHTSGSTRSASRPGSHQQPSTTPGFMASWRSSSQPPSVEGPLSFSAAPRRLSRSGNPAGAWPIELTQTAKRPGSTRPFFPHSFVSYRPLSEAHTQAARSSISWGEATDDTRSCDMYQTNRPPWPRSGSKAELSTLDPAE